MLGRSVQHRMTLPLQAALQMECLCLAMMETGHPAFRV